MNKAYSFLKDLKTDEKHIFEGDFKSDQCYADDVSICEKVIIDNGTWIKDSICLNEDEARKKAAILGRSVCGTCVSHLYNTYDEKTFKK